MGAADPIVLDDDVQPDPDHSTASVSSSTLITQRHDLSPSGSINKDSAGPSPTEPSASMSRDSSPTPVGKMNGVVESVGHDDGSYTDLPAPPAGSISAASQSAHSRHSPSPQPQTSAEQPQASTSAPANPTKPKSTKASARQRSKSPSPPPPPPPPERITIRLTIPLGGPDNYAVDISELAREKIGRAHV